MPDTTWHIEIVAWPSPLFAQADELRFRVLHEPFGVERDDAWFDADPASTHAMALADGEVVGYARLIADPDGGPGQIRQVAVRPDFERQGMGNALMRALLAEARAAGMAEVWLNARVTAVPFYEKLGFTVTSDVFRTPRTFLPHVRMVLALAPSGA